MIILCVITQLAKTQKKWQFEKFVHIMLSGLGGCMIIHISKTKIIPFLNCFFTRKIFQKTFEANMSQNYITFPNVLAHCDVAYQPLSHLIHNNKVTIHKGQILSFIIFS